MNGKLWTMMTMWILLESIVQNQQIVIIYIPVRGNLRGTPLALFFPVSVIPRFLRVDDGLSLDSSGVLDTAAGLSTFSGLLSMLFRRLE